MQLKLRTNCARDALAQGDAVDERGSERRACVRARNCAEGNIGERARSSSASIANLGFLREILEEACEESGRSMKELTVLKGYRDPYRFDTPKNHALGVWFKQPVGRFVPEDEQIHIRGLHYLISSSGDARKIDNTPFVNNDDDYELVKSASYAARWLAYVPFARISDERNEEADLYVPEYEEAQPWLIGNEPIELEIDESLMPSFYARFQPRQRYRIILITEKSSLRPILQPIAKDIAAELLAMTGESSSTRMAEFAARADADGRPAIVLYFSDHDPSGWQMPISVSRKLQALRDLLHPSLDIQLQRAALTAKQAETLELPETPLKANDKRSANWKAKTGREQTELDALIALRPDALRRLALEAIEPFYDDTLAQRCSEAERRWREEANALLAGHRKYAPLEKRLKAAREALVESARVCDELKREAHKALCKVQPPEIDVPEDQPRDHEAGRALFTSKDDFVTATLHLKRQKALVDDTEDE